MLAISVRQPWAALIIHGIKTNECRSWAAHQGMIGQRIAIHAGKQMNDTALEYVTERSEFDDRLKPFVGITYPTQALLGSVKLVGCYKLGAKVRNEEASKILAGYPKPLPLSLAWDDFGNYSAEQWIFVLAEPRIARQPLPQRGQQRFFSVPIVV